MLTNGPDAGTLPASEGVAGGIAARNQPGDPSHPAEGARREREALPVFGSDECDCGACGDWPVAQMVERAAVTRVGAGSTPARSARVTVRWSVVTAVGCGTYLGLHLAWWLR
jgi:hypothetical protein